MAHKSTIIISADRYFGICHYDGLKLYHRTQSNPDPDLGPRIKRRLVERSNGTLIRKHYGWMWARHWYT